METSKIEVEPFTNSSRTCRACLEANLTNEVKFARCTQCSLLFCIHFASNIDPCYCTECLSNVSLYKEIVTKTYESFDDENNLVTQYKRRAKAIRLEGMDWIFAQRKIPQMSDDSLELSIEYHRELLTGLIAEREHRKNKFLHRYAGVVLPERTKIDSVNNTETTIKKTKTISSTRAAATANAMMQSMLASGMTIEKIQEMIEGIQKGVKK